MMRRRFRDIRDGLVEGDNRERGVVLAFLAMILFTLIVMAGLAVDVGNWWWTGQKVQKAADAAAMAGVTYMPEDLSASGSQAKALAQTIASRNGYTNGTNANVVVAGSSKPTELRVTIDTDVDNFFTGILGFKQTNIKRTAVADYAGSVPMGSPADYLGQDPETSGRLQKLWLNVSGRASTKGSGDRFTSRTCGTSTYACSGDNTDADHNGNNEYLFDNAATSNNGYRFVIRVDAVSSNPLKVQVYDPAFIYTGDTCGTNMPSVAQADALQATYANVAPYGTFFNDAGQRYRPSGTDFCPGDQQITYANLNTAYIVRAPDDTPWTDLDNPVVSGCTQTFRPINTSLYKYLDPTNVSWNPADPSYTDGQYVRDNFHRWVNICTIPSSSVQTGDYILQIRTNYSSDPLVTDLSVDTGGHNRFSLRAGFDTGVGIPSSANVSLFANGKLPMYVNAGSSSTPSFYLARILPTAAGRTLRLEFFDIGDVGGSGTVDMQVQPPIEYGSTFSNCVFKRDNASASTSSNCTLTGMTSANYNGRLVTLTIPIPTGYTCDYTVKAGCWVRIRMSFNSGATPTDTTTWSASIDGDPIRLVE
jgi:hypothetical protein